MPISAGSLGLLPRGASGSAHDPPLQQGKGTPLLLTVLDTIRTENRQTVAAYQPGLLPGPGLHRLLLWGGLILAFALRVQGLLALDDSLYAQYLLWDESFYHDWARAILQGEGSDYLVHGYAPLPAYLMALLYRMFAPDPVYVRYANILLGTVSCGVIYLITREFAGKGYALLSLFGAALCLPLIFFSVVVLKTALAVLLFGLLVWLLLLCRRKQAWWLFLFLGAVFGLVFHVRPNVLILLPVLPFLACPISGNPLPYPARLLTSTLLLAIGLALAGSFFIYNSYQESGRLQLTPVQSGFLLYANNNPGNPASSYLPVPFASSHPREQGIQFTIEASRRSGRTLTAGEASAYWRKQVLTGFLQEPGYQLQRMGRKALALLSFKEVDDHYHIGFLSTVVPWFSLPFIPYWLFSLFGMTGLVTGSLHNRYRCVLYPMAVIVILYGATLVLYSPGSRFQTPLLVILIPAAIFSGRELFTAIRVRSLKKTVSCLLFLLLFLIAGTAPTGQGPGMAGHYNSYAFLLDRDGRTREALRWWEQSAGLEEPYSAIAHLHLSGKYYQLHGMDRAVATLEQIPDHSFAAAAKYATLGDIRLHHGDLEQAAQLYRKSLAVNSGQRRVRRQLIRILEKNKDQRLEEEIKNLAFITSFYD